MRRVKGRDLDRRQETTDENYGMSLLGAISVVEALAAQTRICEKHYRKSSQTLPKSVLKPAQEAFNFGSGLGALWGRFSIMFGQIWGSKFAQIWL